ncbi:FAD-dependent oxidoreductase [Xylanimonas allomyrinae]|uniref:FAD-dependent oxidoreductase n=1 Tax=Xylanimonas allomyrinae TaxID=2509459 RepID=UPI0013A643EB|nr:FAD-dependent oxidoreductase [Xylanimonas allomyrinae]
MPRRTIPARAATDRPAGLPSEVEVVVVGAGIVGLAHAIEAEARGASVVVIERDACARGASVRSLGHVAVAAQDGPTLACAFQTRDKWLALRRQAGLVVGESGSVVVASADDEMAVLEDFVCARDGAATLLDRAGVARYVATVGDDVVGGAFLTTDLRVDPRSALHQLALWFGQRPRASVVTGTAVLGVEPGHGRTLVRTSRGDVVARRVVMAVGADVDRLYPGVTEGRLRRRRRHGLRVALESPVSGDSPVVLGGTALLHHAGFTRSPHHTEVRGRLDQERPAVVGAGLNLRATPLADGTLLLGDAGSGDAGLSPFRDESVDGLLLDEAWRLLGARPRVLDRWTATEAVADEPFVATEPQRGLLVVEATGSTGLSTAFGHAARSLDGFL